MQEKHLVVSNKQGKIGLILTDVNNLISYPIDEYTIEDWAKKVDRILPSLDIEKLKEVMDMFITGELEYNHSQGIQNIFKGLKSIGVSKEEPYLKFY